jgi:hypothetical protein
MTWKVGDKTNTSQGASAARFHLSRIRQEVAGAMDRGSMLRLVYRSEGSFNAITDTPSAWKNRLQFVTKSGAEFDLNDIESAEKAE